jgi:rhamnose utilization protein RhaD (predicted bifunctional aldolase and dehydrogenase)
MQLNHARNQRAGSVGMADTEGIRDLSGRLAANRLLVQASTGNTSVKAGDTLWIKASGKWLADAASPDFLIPVALRRARACLDAEETIPETENTGGACASIETAMHAALLHKVVVHVHSVNAVAWALRTDALSAARLSGRLLMAMDSLHAIRDATSQTRAGRISIQSEDGCFCLGKSWPGGLRRKL